MGRHFLAQVQLGSSPAITGPTVKNRGLSKTYNHADPKLGINLFLGGKVGYTLSRNTELTLNINQASTGMIMYGYAPGIPETEFDQHYLFYKLRCTSVDLAWNIFNPTKGSIAPFGTFTGLYIGKSFVSGEVMEDIVEGTPSPPVPSESIGIDPHYSQMYFGFEFGSNHIVYDHILINISLRLNLPFAGIGYYFKNILGSSTGPGVSYKNDYSAYNQFYFEQQALKRVTNYNLFFLNLGVGYLIF